MITRHPEKAEMIFHGNGVSPGIALGRALRLDSHNRPVLKDIIDERHVEDEVARLQQSLRLSKEQLQSLKIRLEEKVGPEHSFILDAHMLMLEDRVLIEDILSEIRTNHANAEWAVRRATDRIRDAYLSLDDEYFRERVTDIEDVVDRILLNLSGDKPINWEHLPPELIIVAGDFSPSNFAAMDLEKVRGLALESGGRTSHSAIIARSLRLPAVMELSDFLSSVATGDLLLLNGNEGELVINPSPDRLDRVRVLLEEFQNGHEPIQNQKAAAVITADQVSVSLRANTELPHEVRLAKNVGAEGIGLFRSEFLFFSHRAGFPDVREQFEAYSMLAAEMAPHPVAVRTLDAGGDKMWPGMETLSEANPSMGLRGIRLSLHARHMFEEQIEAIVRAGAVGKMEIVLPMVSTIEELRSARALIDEVRARTARAAGRDAPPIPVGTMIEVPAAVLVLEHLARESDFLCVGTNDLIQYLLAVDRGNPNVAHLFQPLHPSVLQCLTRIAKVSKEMSRTVRICGEISSNPFFAILLLGMGFTQLSMNPRSIPAIRMVLRRVTTSAAREVLAGALELATTGEIAEYLVRTVTRLVDMDLSLYVGEVTSRGR